MMCHHYDYYGQAFIYENKFDNYYSALELTSCKLYDLLL